MTPAPKGGSNFSLVDLVGFPPTSSPPKRLDGDVGKVDVMRRQRAGSKVVSRT